MRKILLGAALSLVGMMGFAALAVADPDYGSLTLQPSQITEIYDGDTIFIDNPTWPAFAGQHIGVRLNGYDTPERHSACTDPAAKAKEEAEAMQARQVLVTAIAGAKVLELRHVGRDKYFRILAELWIDGQNAADLLVGKNLAVRYHGEKKTGWCGAPASDLPVGISA